VVETFAHFGTGLGLAAGAGLNAYAVLLVYGGIARLFPADFPGAIAKFLADPVTLAVLLGLYLLEFFADKIPGLDHVWDIVHTVVRPVAGALLAVAAVAPTAETPMTILAGGGGGVTALAAHLVKGTARLTSTALTAGVANFALSLAEDILAILQAIVSIFLPLVALVLVVAVSGLFLVCVPKAARGVNVFASRRRRARAAPVPSQPPGATGR
jgi:hypothetical protein